MKTTTYRLIDLCDIKSGKRIPKDMDYVEYPTAHPYIRARDIKDGKINTNDLIYIEDNVYDKIKKYIINSGDIAITVAGSVGFVGYADERVNGFNLTENAVRLTNFKPFVDSRFLFYTLFQKHYFDYMQLVAGAAAQPKLGIYKVERIKVELPDFYIQNEISKKISVYDQLIENNNKRIKLLEQMAENLYKEWFVRFRFPNYENTEFVNGIPKDWEYKKTDRIFIINYGKDHKSLCDGDIPVLGSGGVMRYADKSLYTGESVLIPRKGSLNNIMYIDEPFWTVDTMFYTIPLVEHSAKYIYYTLKNFDMERFNSGASLPSMTTNIIYHLKILLPDKNTLMLFDNHLNPIFLEIKKLKNYNQNLTKQRDLLLPRLMSGKLEV